MANQQNQPTEQNQNKSGINPVNQPDGAAMNRAEAQVRENEDASLQDDSYTFDSDNTDSDEGVDDFDAEDIGLDTEDYQ